MTNKEIFVELKDFRKEFNEKLDTLTKTKMDKEPCAEKHININKLIWSLFGVNLFGIIGIIITIWLKS
jgi:hypothetical protein